MYGRTTTGLETARTIAARFGVVIGAAVVVMALFGVGTSAADPYVGKTYADAAASITNRGGTPVISTVVGSQLPTDQCIVQAWHQPSYAPRTNFDRNNRQFLLSLNCAAKVAGAGKPGNSLATPEGKTQRAIEDRAQTYNSRPDLCEKYLSTCKRFCDRYGMCSKEVNALF